MGFVVWGVGGYLTITNKINYGIFMTFTASLSLIYAPFNFFNNFIFNHTPWTLNSAKRIFVNALCFLYLLGKISYQSGTDSIKLIES